MKFIKRKNIKYLLIIFMMVGVKSFAQLNGYFDRFNAFASNGKVYISCTVSSGRTCNGIDILSSIDSIHYKLIGYIGGVCGSLSEPVSYSYVDENPLKNIKLYYKAELLGYGFSQPYSLEIIDTKGYGFQSRPNPANEKTIIYFENNDNTSHILNLYNISGRNIYTDETLLNFFDIELTNIPSGIFFFTISRKSETSGNTGKLIIQH